LNTSRAHEVNAGACVLAWRPFLPCVEARKSDALCQNKRTGLCLANIDVGPVMEADWHNDLFRRENEPFQG
jgi:hypothetical protein